MLPHRSSLGTIAVLSIFAVAGVAASACTGQLVPQENNSDSGAAGGSGNGGGRGGGSGQGNGSPEAGRAPGDGPDAATPCYGDPSRCGGQPEAGPWPTDAAAPCYGDPSRCWGQPEAGPWPTDAGAPCYGDPSQCWGAPEAGPVDAAPPPFDAGPWPVDGGDPFPGPDSGEWIADAAPDVVAPPPVLDASNYFSWLTQAFVGTWQGVRTDPWGPPATVIVHFDASGSYTGHCVVADPSCSVWYYGVDDDYANKTYFLYDLHANDTGIGRINIAFGPTQTEPGTLDFITIDPSGTHLTFDFSPSWLGGSEEVHFDLQRVGP